LAAFVYGLTKQYNHKKCLELAVKGSREAVKHVGTYILSKDDLENTKVFTNGCFDIMHRGHVEMLKSSKKLGDWLVVGVNTDASVKRLKGKTRPINNESDRKVMLESLDFVDEVILFDEDTPLALINRIQPDIITKGGDYVVETVVGNELAQVVIIPTLDDYSTTNTIQRINDDTT
jgi:D-beta-D-heptose 7-phosphate kinase/D-beta-D-heptose 1-phosphate adenosyltransferase